MRLTTAFATDENGKAINYAAFPIGDRKVQYEICQKLGQLEDIEEELGIDLIALFKALKNGYAWIRTKQGIQKATVGAFSLKNLKVVLSYDMSEGGWNFHKNMHLTDYGKTWALTKEELTNGK